MGIPLLFEANSYIDIFTNLNYKIFIKADPSSLRFFMDNLRIRPNFALRSP